MYKILNDHTKANVFISWNISLVLYKLRSPNIHRVIKRISQNSKVYSSTLPEPLGAPCFHLAKLSS